MEPLHDSSSKVSNDELDGRIKRLPELATLEALIERGGALLRTSVACHVTVGGVRLPLYIVEMGRADADAPVVAFVGGVHGVERIGTRVVLAFLGTLIERMHWDPLVGERLNRLRLLFVPLVNPGGMWLGRRSNPRGIDLMRNAPVDAKGRVSPLLGGHRIGNWLPWYRGRGGNPMEPEAQVLCNLIGECVAAAPFALALDVHSGFGMQDRVWFPYAHSSRPFPQATEVFALKRLFENTYPNHAFYVFEPQARHYTTHGDPWDYLHGKSTGPCVFLPLTLEMGSWRWIKKNPWRHFNFPGIFNPVLPHRTRRVLRRHQVLMEFLLAAAAEHAAWLPTGVDRDALGMAAQREWYSERNHG